MINSIKHVLEPAASSGLCFFSDLYKVQFAIHQNLKHFAFFFSIAYLILQMMMMTF